MFEPTKAPNYLLATDRDGQHRHCAAVMDRRSREIVATAILADVTYHVPSTAGLVADVELALQPFMNRLKEGTP